MNKKSNLIIWQEATNKLAEEFVRKYHGDMFIEDMYWIGGDIGGVLNVGDQFWGLDRIHEALELNATLDQVFDYDSYELDCALEGKQKQINFKNYVKYGFQNNQ